MKTRTSTFRSVLKGLAVAALAVGVSAQSAKAGQPDDQIAIQLGALQLGINLGNATQLQQAQALVQGRAVLASTSKTAKPVVQGGNFTASQVQTTLTQNQIQLATLAALSSPFTGNITKQVVSLSNNKTTSVTAKLSPKLTTASAIAGYALKRIPNYGPLIVQAGVEAAFSGQGNATFNYKGTTPQKIQAAQLADAGKVASIAMSSSLKAYAGGTVNWAGVPKTGTVFGATYLPNFGTKVLPSANVANQQLATPGLITKYASAIAANAINGLGNIAAGPAGTYGKNQTNVQSLTAALVKGAVAFQKTSLTPDLTPGQKTVGSIGASVLGITAQVSGDQNGGAINNTFGTTAVFKDVLQGVINGAIASAKTQAWAVAIGVAQGFTGTYLATTYNASNTPVNLAAFIALNAGEINTAFLTANKGKAYTKAQLGTYTTLADAINAGITAMYTAFDVANGGANKDFSNISGAGGIRNFDLVNGVGIPVTDTVGL